jgi:mRNA-degrading endonuclease toxin of MazEF toxin-antitoxin module
MKRGNLYWADLLSRFASEQTRRRPVLVVSYDSFNQTPAWLSGIVVPLSTSSSQASEALCHQVTTLDRARLTRKLGQLPAPLLAQVEDGLKAALALD